jgi:hypothetical protein
VGQRLWLVIFKEVLENVRHSGTDADAQLDAVSSVGNRRISGARLKRDGW